MKITLKIAFVLWLFMQCVQTMAQHEPGLSGFVQLSGSYMNFKTNTIAGFMKSGISENISYSLYDKPHKQQFIATMGASELKYTFKNKKWQLYFGGSLLDIVRLELVQQFAVRKFNTQRGYIGLGILGTGIPVSVWEDPYAIGECGRRIS